MNVEVLSAAIRIRQREARSNIIRRQIRKITQNIQNRRDEIIALAKRYGGSNLRLFGSVARGDAVATSDVDFLVRFEPGRSLFDQGGLLMDLRELLGVNVDVASDGALAGRFAQIVRAEAVEL